MMKSMRPLWAALAVAGVFTLHMPATAVAMIATGEAPAATDGQAALDALQRARIGDLRQVEALLQRGGLGPATASLLEAQYAAAHGRDAAARDALARYFASADADPARMTRAWEVASETAFVAGRYEEAARYADLLLTRSQNRNPFLQDGTRRLLEIATLLAREPGQVLERPGNGQPVPLKRDKVGLLRAEFSTGQSREEALLDTGANLSVASASAAARLGLRIIDGASSVGNSLGGSVDVKLGIADRLEFGGAVLRNVVFVIMDDAALEFPVPGGYRIDAIIGLPVMRAVGRMDFGPGETLRITGSEATAEAPGNLRLIGSNPFVVTTIADQTHALFLDTGANRSSLSKLFAAARPDLMPEDTGEVGGKAGVGGAEKVRHALYRALPVAIGGPAATAMDLKLELADSEDPDQPEGIIGADILSRFESFSIDFGSMTLSVGQPRVAAARPATHAR